MADFPILADRKTLQLFFGSYQLDAATRHSPDFKTCTMALLARRSPTRRSPRVSDGKSGAIFANGASLSQNRSDFITTSFQGRESHLSDHANQFIGLALTGRSFSEKPPALL